MIKFQNTNYHALTPLIVFVFLLLIQIRPAPAAKFW